MDARQESGQLARRTLSCVMNSHEACDGLVSGGKRQGVHCLCECHNDPNTNQEERGTMTPTTEELMTEVRRDALRKLQLASIDVIRHAEEVRRDLVRIVGQVQDGLITHDFSTQSVFDLKAALVKRSLLVELALSTDAVTGDVVNASKGERT